MFIQKYRYMQEAAEEMGDAGQPAEQPTEQPSEQPTAQSTESQEPQGYWPDDWRQKYAGEDEGKLNRLSRYASPEAAMDALLAAQDRIRQGEVKQPFPVDGTEEEQNAWRENNGLPATPEDYDLTFDNGLVIGDDDKEFVDGYLKYAHETNQTPEQVKANLEFYYENIEKQQEARYEQDKQIAAETNEKLREMWGGEYKAHKNAIQSFLDGLPEESREGFAAARMPDGTPVLSDPNILNWMLSQALEINPASTVVPAGGNQMASIEDEISNLESMMADRSSEYWKGPKSDSNQERLRKLYEARDKLKEKS